MAQRSVRKGGKSPQGKSAPGRLRIVAGKWRSRLLAVADVPGLRPTSARVRETVFNWLGPGLPGAHCLDLFAGSGAMGFEALSRGAADAVFVEQDSRAVAALQKARSELDAADATIVRQDAYRYVQSAAPRAFDIVFLDPPYADDSISELCRLLDAGGWVAPGGTVYFEQDRAQAPATLPGGWELSKEKNAGQVRYCLAVSGATA